MGIPLNKLRWYWTDADLTNHETAGKCMAINIEDDWRTGCDPSNRWSKWEGRGEYAYRGDTMYRAFRLMLECIQMCVRDGIPMKDLCRNIICKTNEMQYLFSDDTLHALGLPPAPDDCEKSLGWIVKGKDDTPNDYPSARKLHGHQSR